MRHNHKNEKERENTTMKKLFLFAVMGTFLITSAVRADSKTATVGVEVGAEAAFTAATNATLTTAGNFAAYSGSSTFTYQVRTSASGAGSVTVKVTTDFSPGSGPSVGTPPTAGDVLSYISTTGGVGTGASSTTASTSADTTVLTFGSGISSSATGDLGNMAWTLTDDPKYATGSYTATITYTISAT
jgi:hypothetical protein